MMPNTTDPRRPLPAFLTRNVDLFAQVVGEDSLPTEFRLFAAGINDTTKGPMVFDEMAAAAVMAAAADWGNEYPVDYDHAMLGFGFMPPTDPASAGKAAGWFVPELRDGELWASRVTWTPQAARMLRDREYRYTSPAIGRDEARVVELINVALTNLPATKHLAPLVAGRVSHAGERTLREPTDSTTSALAMSFNEISRALRHALRDRYAPASESEWDGPSIEEVFDDAVVFVWEGKLYRCNYRLAGSGVVLEEPAVEVHVAYEPVMKEQVMKKLLLALGLDENATEDAALEAFAKMVPPAKAEPEKPAELPPEALSRLAAKDAALELARKDADDAKAELAKLREAETLAKHVAQATALKAIPAKPDDLGRVLMALHAKAPGEAKYIEELLGRANAVLAGSKLFDEVGVGGEVGEPDPVAQLDKLAKEKRTADPKLSTAAARVAVYHEHPEILAAIRGQQPDGDE